MNHSQPFAASVMKVAANETIRTIAMQAHRARSATTEDELDFFDDSFFRRDADHALFTIALSRLDDIAALTAAHLKRGRDGQAASELEKSRAHFALALGDVKLRRNLVAHVADYAAGSGRNASVASGSLYSGKFTDGTRAITPEEPALDDVLREANELYAAIVEALQSA